MWITGLADHCLNRWSSLTGRYAHEREQMIARGGNPIIAPNPAETRRAVWDYFDAADRYEGALHGLEFRLDDPDWHGDPADEQHRHLDPARAEVETAAARLIEILVQGGRPPWRWTLQRSTRRVHYLRWYLRERQWQPEHRHRGDRRDPWANAPIAGAVCPRCRWDDEPPF